MKRYIKGSEKSRYQDIVDFLKADGCGNDIIDDVYKIKWAPNMDYEDIERFLLDMEDVSHIDSIRYVSDSEHSKPYPRLEIIHKDNTVEKVKLTDDGLRLIR